MGKGIREMAMSQEPEAKPLFGEYRPYPSQYGEYNPRYDGEYEYKEEKEPTNLISIKMIVTYEELGPEFDMDNELYSYEPEKAELKAKEIAYDRLVNFTQKGFESKYSMTIEATDSYTEYEIEIILTPLKQ
ncbi:MAG: hypothetical protein NT094_01475 [Candidatus Staskawiczbacteria bacterium]|nr:hypothetical protein [Candidatus Staskawiczbacteria bacterium]